MLRLLALPNACFKNIVTFYTLPLRHYHVRCIRVAFPDEIVSEGSVVLNCEVLHSGIYGITFKDAGSLCCGLIRIG